MSPRELGLTIRILRGRIMNNNYHCGLSAILSGFSIKFPTRGNENSTIGSLINLVLFPII